MLFEIDISVVVEDSPIKMDDKDESLPIIILLLVVVDELLL